MTPPGQAAPAIDADRVLADLRDLAELTGGPEGARRVCWTDVWETARSFLRDRLAEVGVEEIEIDEAGNLWARLPGRDRETPGARRRLSPGFRSERAGRSTARSG